MSLQDTVLDILKEKGPLLPAQIVSETNKATGKSMDMFFVGAILSELMGSKQVKMSHAKIGGSRVYYCPGQEEKLQMLYEGLNDKEKKAYDKLKEEKVLRESGLDPVIRVAIQNLKDFAISIEVKLREKERFWSWYLFPLEESKRLIQDKLKDEIAALKKSGQTEKPVEKAIDKAEKNESNFAPANNSENLHPKKEITDQASQETNISQDHNASANSKLQDKDTSNRVFQQEDVGNSKSGNEQFISHKSSTEYKDSLKTSVKNVAKDRGYPTHFEKRTRQNVEEGSEHQSKLSDNENSGDYFFNKILAFFERKGISVKNGDVLKKNSEAEFEIDVDTSLGNLTFYAFAKSKKKISEPDISLAFVKSQQKQLPLCFISTGDLTKKSQDFMKDEMKGAIYLKMN